MDAGSLQVIWNAALEKVRATLPTAADQERLARYLPFFISHELDGDRFVIRVPQQIQAELFEQLYAEPLSAALHEFGLDESIGIAFSAEQKSETSPSAPAPQRLLHPAVNIPLAVQAPQPPKIVRGIPSTMPLHENYTFENFVRGPSNSFAHAAATAVAKGPGRTSYNPLFIYGGTGLGKTHLMEAIGHAVLKANPAASVCFLTSETFLNEYVNAIANNDMPAFRERYRKVDLLLLDDVQFIAGKKQFQEEFFNTFNSLMLYNRQVVMTSDVAPKDLQGCEERLTGRFQQGMVVEIESPSYETRLAILTFKAQGTKHIIPEEILKYIAENIRSHVRAIEGALQRVVTFMDLNGPDIPLTIEVVKHLLKDALDEEDNIKDLSVDEIMQTVAKHYGVTLDDITSSTRTQTLVTPRQVAMFLSRKLTSKSLPEIAKAFEKTHATVHHGMQAIQKRMDVEKDLCAAMEEIVSKLGRNFSDLTA